MLAAFLVGLVLCLPGNVFATAASYCKLADKIVDASAVHACNHSACLVHELKLRNCRKRVLNHSSQTSSDAGSGRTTQMLGQDTLRYAVVARHVKAHVQVDLVVEFSSQSHSSLGFSQDHTEASKPY